MKVIYLFLFGLLLSLQQPSSYAQSISPAALTQLEFIFQDSLVDYREVYSVQINGSRADTVSSLFLQKNQAYISSGYELLAQDSLPWKGNRNGNINEVTGFAPNGVDSIFREDLYKDASGRDTLINVFLDTGRSQLDLRQRLELIYGPQGVDTFRVINFVAALGDFDFVVVRDAQQRTDSLYIYINPQNSPIPVQAYDYIYNSAGNRIDTIITLNTQNNFSIINKLRPTYDSSSGKIERVDVLQADGSGEFTVSQRIIFNTASAMGTRGLLKENALNLYPNPSRGKVQLQGFSGKADLSLLKIDGQEVKSWEEVKAGEALSIEDLPAGAYFLRISTDRSQYTLPLQRE